MFLPYLGIEFGTSHYRDEINAYDKIPGKDIGDDWYVNGFMAEYNYNKLVDGVTYEDFDLYIDEIGGAENLTEELFYHIFSSRFK